MLNRLVLWVKVLVGIAAEKIDVGLGLGVGTCWVGLAVGVGENVGSIEALPPQADSVSASRITIPLVLFTHEWVLFTHEWVLFTHECPFNLFRL